MFVTYDEFVFLFYMSFYFYFYFKLVRNKIQEKLYYK